MASQGIREAVLLDALGTLVRLEPPGPRLQAELRRRTGVEVSEEAAASAFRAEIDYYLAHHLEGRDAESLRELRDRCAGVLVDALGDPGLERQTVREAMLASLRFTAYPDAAPALRELRREGLALVVASNWDCSLPEVLERAGLASLLDAVIASAAVGTPKPGAELFRAAVVAAGARPGRALHVGDSLANDVEGALAAGIGAVLLVRAGPAPMLPPGAHAIAGLAELPSLISP